MLINQIKKKLIVFLIKITHLALFCNDGLFFFCASLFLSICSYIYKVLILILNIQCKNNSESEILRFSVMFIYCLKPILLHILFNFSLN